MTQNFRERIDAVDPSFTSFERLQTLQVNLGDICNLACSHCHVGASANGSRVMGREVMAKIAAALRNHPGLTLDITGGCPEMNPDFRFLVDETEGLSPRRILRSNLTIMTEPGMEWLPQFCRDRRLVITASLPCYLEENVDRQRGAGTYDRSIRALRELNSLGYGGDLELNLVYNPGGPFLPSSQQELESAYREELARRFGIVFHSLFTITNATVGRFRDELEAKGGLERYTNLLATRFNPEAAAGMMCRTMVSVDWRGVLYDCDFNQVLEMPLRREDGTPLWLDDLAEAATAGREILFGGHCYCCTAGEGSSCTGALAA
jgi:radical SAM/Cys-rich protein